MKIAPAFALTASLLVASLSAAAAAAPAALDHGVTALTNERWLMAVHLSKDALADPKLSATDTVKALNNLCIGLTKAGRYDEALDACSKGIALNAGQWATYINRGNLLAMMGDLTAARADYERAKALSPMSPAVVESAAVKLNVGTVTTAPFVALTDGETPVTQTATSNVGE